MSGSTPHQRLYIRTMLQQLDLPLDYVTRMNFATFKAAGIATDPALGRRLDGVLEELTKQQAMDLIRVLKKEVDDVA